MASVLRMNHFAVAANQALLSTSPKFLIADATGIGVRQIDLPSSFSPHEKQQNSLTWKIFRENLIPLIGNNKFDWICHRYRAKLNFTRMEKSGKPLLPEHVELFGIGMGQVLSQDLKSRYQGKIRTLTREQLSDRMRQIQPFPIFGSYVNPVRMNGAPGSLLAHLFHDKLRMDKEKQLLFSDVAFLSFPSWLERFTKIVTNRELIEGQIIPAPGQDGRIDYYKVYRKIGTGDGLVAYALKPATSDSTLKPLIAFRPSQWAISNEDAFETYLNDVQPNVGEMGWKAAVPEFQKLMLDPKFRRNQEKISLAGYSLGGAHAQYFLATHADNVSYAVFYNDPSVDNATAENFAKRMNSSGRRTEPLNIQIFHMEGDFCAYVGDKHVGHGVKHPDVNIQLMEGNHENKKAAAFKLHSHRIFDNTTFRYNMKCYDDTQQLFDRLDNTKRGADVFWYEKTRKVWGGIAFTAIYALSRFVNFVSWVLGVKILRSSKDKS